MPDSPADFPVSDSPVSDSPMSGSPADSAAPAPARPGPSPPSAPSKGRRAKGKKPWTREDVVSQIWTQLALLVVLAVVMFPVVWVLSLALDSRDISKPDSLALIPPDGVSLEAFRRVLIDPFTNLCPDSSDISTCMTFTRLLTNSLIVALGTSVLAVVLGASAAYAFSRFRFWGRKIGLLSFIALIMMPSTGVLAPLFVLLNTIRIGDEPLRKTLIGLSVAYTAVALPFAIWNLKGYFDTVPIDLEEAALVDGASPLRVFVRIVLPLSTPALAVTVLFAFMAGWTEFILAWLFLDDPGRFTLAMALRGMQGQFTTPWSDFSAMSVLMSLPVILLFFGLQRWIVSGLTVGGVKG